ncbi:MAG: hypothetical protein GY841_01255 [FCB group bacterium]|nr:hypothetical protein [FCB group bacterium]
MENILDFARGPLFRFSLAVMLLGLLRILIIDLIAIIVAYRRAGDTTLPWNFIIRRTFKWLFPFNRALANRPAYSLLSIFFHVGLLLVPIFLFAHVELWHKAIGIAWPTLPKPTADVLTVITIVCAIGLFLGRIFSQTSRFISRKQDYLWPILIIMPFVSGFACASVSLSPSGYQTLMLIHILSADVIFLLMPFTKIAHCILMPLSQIISNLAWRFPADTDDDVCTTLNKKGAPV